VNCWYEPERAHWNDLLIHLAERLGDLTGTDSALITATRCVAAAATRLVRGPVSLTDLFGRERRVADSLSMCGLQAGPNRNCLPRGAGGG